MARNEISYKFKAIDQGQERLITVKATDSVCVEDCYTVLTNAVLHRYKTGEDVVPTISRDIKDALIRVNLVV
jgi:hypothetical protein